MYKITVSEILIENIKNKKIVKYIFSDTKTYNYSKVILKPVIIKNDIKIQIESFKENKVFHNNFNFNDERLFSFINEYIDNFKQILAQIPGYDFIFNKKNEIFSKKERKNNLDIKINSHNREKKYFLNEGEKIDFLIMLNVMSEEGKVFKNSYNKFRQINKYLEFID